MSPEKAAVALQALSYDYARLILLSPLISHHAFAPGLRHGSTAPGPWDAGLQNIWGSAAAAAALQLIQIKSADPLRASTPSVPGSGPHCLLQKLINDTRRTAKH